ncbi:tripeptidyl-peptidase 1 isoform X1 [Hydra vulgaris]|uniref:Tripeptidyl-peptidase 1 n=1 Tax=Hydra vulgaris TaxID=6087 RepID=T2MJM0_HYDVU|nr:tripeptidyl-peptidase 1 [Hydra vulgaris]
MSLIKAIIFTILLAIEFSSASLLHALEKDQNLYYWQNEGWIKADRVSEDKIIELTFALKQQNVKQLEDFLLQVSNPDSSLYGKYVSVEQLTRMIQPKDDSIEIVSLWLKQNDVNDCELTLNKDFIRCTMKVEIAEKLLPGSNFYNFQHKKYSRNVVRSVSHYQVPNYIAEHIDFVGGLHRFPAVNFFKTKFENINYNKNHYISHSELFHIGVYPSVLRKRYNLTADDVGSHPNNSQVVAQFLEQYFNPNDLSEFMSIFVGKDFPHKTSIEKVIGPDTGRSGVEASLDTQYIMGLGANITTWFWSTPGRHDNQEPFLTWLVDISNTSQVPWVHSVSYGEDESTLSEVYMNRVNIEFMKTGARGLTILFASGDNGAGCQGNKFSPNFPVSSPYVTGVGGTAFKNPFGSGEETSYEISGGGFSNLFLQPSYQSERVNEYLKSDNVPPEQYFNKSGRAYPDIAALSNHFWIVNNRIPVPGVAGTSAATPTVAGIISMLNERRLQNNKPPMGFINPFLYKNPQAFFDILGGCNEGCLNTNDKGFCAEAGFDPVTGNGTPNYPELLKAAMNAVN